MTQRRPLPTKPLEPEQAADPQPRGIALAVIFDWAIATGGVFLLLVALVQHGINTRSTAAAALLALLLAPPLIILGETLRRGRAASRLLQIAVAIMVAVASIAGTLRDFGELISGKAPRSASPLFLLISLYIVWGLLRPQTAAWFARVTATAAHQRHRGPWLFVTLFLSTTVGIAAVFINLAR